MTQSIFRHACGILLILTSLSMSGITATAQSTWMAGVARANIVPEQPTWMAGYASRDRPAEGKTTELWAKALALKDADGKRGLLITLDLVGIERELSQAICSELSETLGLQRSEIALCTSHTHSGPVVGLNLAPMHYAVVPPMHQKRIQQYSDTLKSKLVSIAEQAFDDLEPCELLHGMGNCDFATNRRNNRADEVPTLRTAGHLVGPKDHDVPVLAVKANDDHAWKAVVFGYACHATVLSEMQWSGDYPGYAQIEFEKLYPGCQAMFWAGCGGDQNPLPRRTVTLAEHYGRQLAGAVDAVLLTTHMETIPPRLHTRYTEIDLKLGPLPTGEQLRQTVKSGNRYEQARATMLLEQIAREGALASTYPYPIAVWKLAGQVDWVILGGEVVVDYAIRLKDELPGRVWVSGYSNDVMAYIPSRRVLAEGGYEGARSMVYYGLPTVWDPTIENDIVDQVHALVREPVETSDR